ncbi:hypothetical protein CGUA_06660 [Corynebacterium guangdongense]|nr:hypothetical protein CGUA_06660 [Corynebacterium guangdongense]
MIQRLTNLAFALLGTGQVRESEWIRANVDGYSPQQSDEAFARMLQRDIQTLRRAGVPVVQTESGYAVEKESYELPAVTFTPEEARVLGMAGEMGRSGELGVFARSGWTKLAAAGAARDLADAPIYQADTDLDRLSPELLRDVSACIHHRIRMRFDYRPIPTRPSVRRTMDPWGVVHWNNRIYLVGWDVDRGAPRSFRALRCSGVKGLRRTSAEHIEPTEDLLEVVKAALAQGRDFVDALVRVPAGTAKELADAGTRQPDDPELVRMPHVERDWLVRTAASYVPGVEVLEPEDLRDQIRDLLKEAL